MSSAQPQMSPQSNPLENLRDIHLPDTISAWPPAPGWWILALLLISLLIWLGWKIWNKYQQKQLLRLSLANVIKLESDYQQHQDPQLLVRQYSSLLRRVALARFPRQQVASITGSRWLEFLDNSSDTKLFDSEIGRLLLDGPYQKSSDNIDNIDTLTRAVHQWLKAVDSSGVNHD